MLTLGSLEVCKILKWSEMTSRPVGSMETSSPVESLSAAFHAVPRKHATSPWGRCFPCWRIEYVTRCKHVPLVFWRQIRQEKHAPSCLRLRKQSLLPETMFVKFHRLPWQKRHGQSPGKLRQCNAHELAKPASAMLWEGGCTLPVQ